MKRLGVRPSVCPSVCLSQQRAAGLLLCARRAGDIDRLSGVESARRVSAKAAVHCYIATALLNAYLLAYSLINSHKLYSGPYNALHSDRLNDLSTRPIVLSGPVATDIGLMI